RREFRTSPPERSGSERALRLPTASPGRGRGDVLADEGACTDPGDDIALAQEPLIGVRHGRPRNAQPPGELARRRQALAGPYSAVADGAPQLFVDLATEPSASDKADVEFHRRTVRGLVCSTQHKLALPRDRLRSLNFGVRPVSELSTGRTLFHWLEGTGP